jgi:CheY-like chemotaxis protein
MRGKAVRFRKVLVVDDNEVCLNTLINLLQPVFSITTANNGATALALYHAGHFDVVVTDDEMPEMSGLDLCQQVSPTTPVYVMSSAAIHQQALAAGATLFFDKGDMLSLVNHLKEGHCVRRK